MVIIKFFTILAWVVGFLCILGIITSFVGKNEYAEADRPLFVAGLGIVILWLIAYYGIV